MMATNGKFSLNFHLVDQTFSVQGLRDYVEP